MPVYKLNENTIGVRCSCFCQNHNFEISYFDEDAAYVEFCLAEPDNFFKRVWWGIKYILGKRPPVFNEIVINKYDAMVIISFLKEFINRG